MSSWKLTRRGWVALYTALALLATAFLVWSDATWAGPRPTAEQEATWSQ